MKSIATLLGAALVASAMLAAPSYADDKERPKQRPQAGKRDCSKAKDPARCQAQREKFRAASTACKGKSGADRSTCMSEQLCAKSEDPAKCKARAAERKSRKKARHARTREACKDKTGEARAACMREQRRRPDRKN